MEKPFRRILIIKMRFHGDMLLTTPVISTLKQNYPDAKIDVLLYQNTIPILSENPEINALYGISNKGTGTKEKIKNALSLVKNCVLITMTWSSISPINGVWRLLCVFRRQNKDLTGFWQSSVCFMEKSFTHLVPYAGNTLWSARCLP